MIGSRIGLVAALVAGSGLAVVGQAPRAQAAEYIADVVISTDSIRCGYFANNQQCFGFTRFTDGNWNIALGDTLKMSVKFEDRFHVPGSSESNFVSVLAVTANAVLGGGGPGDNRYQGQLTMNGYAGPLYPLAGTYEFTSIDAFGAGGGFCCGYGVPNGGYSLTGMDASVLALSNGVGPLVGIAAGYSVVLPATPATIDNLRGGSPDAPVILPPGGVGKITGNIAGPYSAESFYGFTWGGGTFETIATIVGADPGTSFTFKLINSSGDVLYDPVLIEDNQFSATIRQSFLAKGVYRIGLMTTSLNDPSFSIDFRTPVNFLPASAVPEPASWAMLITGFGLVGAALRQRRPRAAYAPRR